MSFPINISDFGIFIIKAVLCAFLSCNKISIFKPNLGRIADPSASFTLGPFHGHRPSGKFFANLSDTTDISAPVSIRPCAGFLFIIMSMRRLGLSEACKAWTGTASVLLFCCGQNLAICPAFLHLLQMGLPSVVRLAWLARWFGALVFSYCITGRPEGGRFFFDIQDPVHIVMSACNRDLVGIGSDVYILVPGDIGVAPCILVLRGNRSDYLCSPLRRYPCTGNNGCAATVGAWTGLSSSFGPALVEDPPPSTVSLS